MVRLAPLCAYRTDVEASALIRLRAHIRSVRHIAEQDSRFKIQDSRLPYGLTRFLRTDPPGRVSGYVRYDSITAIMR